MRDWVLGIRRRVSGSGWLGAPRGGIKAGTSFVLETFSGGSVLKKLVAAQQRLDRERDSMKMRNVVLGVIALIVLAGMTVPANAAVHHRHHRHHHHKS